MGNKTDIFFEIIGWYGAAAVMLAYALVSYRLVSPTGIAFQLLNISGAIGLIVISYKKKVWQSVSLNVIWAVIGIIALIQTILSYSYFTFF